MISSRQVRTKVQITGDGRVEFRNSLNEEIFKAQPLQPQCKFYVEEGERYQDEVVRNNKTT